MTCQWPRYRGGAIISRRERSLLIPPCFPPRCAGAQVGNNVSGTNTCTMQVAAQPTHMVEAEVPPGMVAGSQFIVRAPDGSSLMVTLPPGLSVGDKFHVAMPDAYATQGSNPGRDTSRLTTAHSPQRSSASRQVCYSHVSASPSTGLHPWLHLRRRRWRLRCPRVWSPGRRSS